MKKPASMAWLLRTPRMRASSSLVSTKSAWAMEDRAMSLSWRTELETSLRACSMRPGCWAASPRDFSMEFSIFSMMCRGCRNTNTYWK